MIRSLTFASLASLFALTIGCSGAPGATQNDDSSDDALTGANGGLYIGSAPGLTGGISVHLANAKTTKCADGSRKSICAVFVVDYSNLNLSAADEKSLDDAFKAGQAVVKGKLAIGGASNGHETE